MQASATSVIMSTISPPPQPGTPIHTRSTTTDRYGPRYQNRDTILSRLTNKMGPFIIGPISADAFLKSFLPSPLVPLASPFAVGMFIPLVDMLSKPETESKYYKVFMSSDPCHSMFLGLTFPFQIEIFSHLLQNLTIKNTSGTTDQAPYSSFPFNLKPDCSVYANSEEMEKKSEMYLNSSCVNFVIEFKCKPEADPFADNLSEGGSNPFACPTGPTLIILGQLTAYTTSILSAQYRMHMFMSFIVKYYVRLI